MHGLIYEQDCEVSGLPPAQPEGVDEVIVLVCTPDEEQADQAEYSNEAQVEV